MAFNVMVIKSNLGTTISPVEVAHVSLHGVWIMSRDKELFLDYEHFPWFKDASIGKVMNVTEVSPEHFYWPELDIDLSMGAIEDPEQFPLLSK